MLEKKNIILNMVLPPDIKSYILYCLTVDVSEFEDIKLNHLRRLELIITIFDKILKGQLPNDPVLQQKYFHLLYSFRGLLRNVFAGYTFGFCDPHDSSRENVMSLTSNYDNSFIIIDAEEFTEYAKLILEYNGIEIPYFY